MKIAIRQRFSLDFGTAPARAVEQLLLTPRNGPTQTIEAWTVRCEGFEGAAQFTDGFGNIAHLVSQSRPEGALVIDVEGAVETFDRNGVVGRPAGEPVPALFRRATTLTKPAPGVVAKVRALKPTPLAMLHAIMQRLGELHSFTHRRAPSAPQQSQSQTQSQDGQSQSQSQGEVPAAATAIDFAHQFIGVARALDIPARFVSGYCLADDGSGHFHAWSEAWLDDLGWVAFDPALGYCPVDRHVRLAVGLDAVSAAPVRAHPAAASLVPVATEVGEA